MSHAPTSSELQLAHLAERLPSHEREGQIFWKLRSRVGRNQLKYLFTQSRLRTSLVIGLSVFFWVGLFILFYSGFDFVVAQVGPPGATYHAQTVRFVFTLFFVSLQVMLVFSAGIILYGGLFASRETTLLMVLPIRDERLVFYRFQEALFFSSWGFFLLASPMIVAYGMVVEAPWYYYAYLPALVIAFAYIPCALGALACLILVSHLPQLRKAIVCGVALVVIVIAYHSIWRTLDIAGSELLGATWFMETFQRFEFTRGEWLPSTWLSNALLDAARPQGPDPADLPWLESGKYLIVLLSNALILHLLVLWSGRRLFRASYSGLYSGQARQTRPRMAGIDVVTDWMMGPFSREIRLLIIKDLRLFRRDPVQWSQFLIFFGLLLLYFANIDRFRQHRADLSVMAWVNIVSFLNLAVVGLILSTFTTRFIYPLISLEGRRFWILGRLPVDRDTILWGKFLFAACGSWLPCAGLVLISDLMLDVSVLAILVHQVICLFLCVGLSGMAVGLGALMPNFSDQSPSKIAAGFGGTLNLVLSALYILVIVLLTARPCHFYLLEGRGELTSSFFRHGYLDLWMGAGIVVSLTIALVVTLVPMHLGLKAFRRLEV
jgi:ABC-2 type transport system permease protein